MENYLNSYLENLARRKAGATTNEMPPQFAVKQPWNSFDGTTPPELLASNQGFLPSAPIEKRYLSDDRFSSSPEENVPSPTATPSNSAVQEQISKYLEAKGKLPIKPTQEELASAPNGSGYDDARLIATIGQAGARAGAAIAGIKPENEFWNNLQGQVSDKEKMEANKAKAKEDREFKLKYLDEQKEARKLVAKEKADIKKQNDNFKKSEQYGLVRRGMKRGGGLLKQLENRQLALNFIEGALDDIEAGRFVPDSQTLKALSAQMSLAQTGSAPQLSIINDTDYQNAKRYLADKMQWVTNNPKEAASSGVLKQIRSQMNVLKRGVADKYNNIESDLLNSQMTNVLKDSPELLKQHMFNLDQSVDIITDEQGNFLTSLPKGFAGTKKGINYIKKNFPSAMIPKQEVMSETTSDAGGWTEAKAKRLAELRAKLGKNQMAGGK